jgi:biopolymer transport protein ExbB
VTGPELPPGDGIPVDAAGTAAAATHAGMTLAVWLAAGRFFIWPIIAVFALGLAIVAWRAWVLMGRRVDRRRLVTVLRTAARPDRAAAAALVAAGATPLDRVLRAGLDAVDRPPEVRESAVEQVLIHETGDLHRGIPAIAVLAGVAPLLGLLGTVTGMIDMFGVIAAEGSGNATSLSGGISEALVCTQAGMLAAIPLLLAHAWLGRLAERRAQRLEEAACGVLGLSS